MSRSRRVSLVKRASPSGLSRLDLLAVILIGGFFIAMFFPYEGGAREAARRNQCMNNLKQMALAALNHESSKKFLPSGGWVHNWIGDPDGGLGKNQPGGWAYSILFFTEGSTQIRLTSDLPEAERVALGATILGAGPNAAQNQKAIQPMFYCPSRRPAALYPYGDSLLPGYAGAGGTNWTPLFKPYLMAKSDYAADGGTIGFNDSHDLVKAPNDIIAALELGPSLAESVASLPAPDSTWYLTPAKSPDGSGETEPSPKTIFTGVIWYRSQVSLRMILDGTSRVYLFGEKYLDQFDYTTGANGTGDEANLYVGMDDDNIRLGASGGIYAPDAPSSVSPGSDPPDRFGRFRYPPMQDASVWPAQVAARPAKAPADYFNAMRFGSAHVPAFNMAFCDGSVHAVAYDIDPLVHASLCDRQDGQPTDPAIGQ